MLRREIYLWRNCINVWEQMWYRINRIHAIQWKSVEYTPNKVTVIELIWGLWIWQYRDMKVKITFSLLLALLTRLVNFSFSQQSKKIIHINDSISNISPCMLYIMTKLMINFYLKFCFRLHIAGRKHLRSYDDKKKEIWCL